MLIQSEVDRGTKRANELVTELLLDSDDDEGPIVSKKGTPTSLPLDSKSQSKGWFETNPSKGRGRVGRQRRGGRGIE
jgi:hypothetical protein